MFSIAKLPPEVGVVTQWRRAAIAAADEARISHAASREPEVVSWPAASTTSASTEDVASTTWTKDDELPASSCCRRSTWHVKVAGA